MVNQARVESDFNRQEMPTIAATILFVDMLMSFRVSIQ